MPGIGNELREATGQSHGTWWVPIFLAWSVVPLVVFRLNPAPVAADGVLGGVVSLVSAFELRSGN